MRPLDYGLSFICNPSPANSVRFWIESRTRITDPKRGTTTDYYQCASCKSEHTFAAKDLLHDDNYDFLPILGGEDLLIFRRHARLTPTYRQLYKAVDVWGAPIFKPREAETVVVLDTWEKIEGATAAGVPIVTQTQIADEGTGLKATIECPTKTMNISIENRIYQVDTGPIALPDLRTRTPRSDLPGSRPQRGREPRRARRLGWPCHSSRLGARYFAPGTHGWAPRPACTRGGSNASRRRETVSLSPNRQRKRSRAGH